MRGFIFSTASAIALLASPLSAAPAGPGLIDAGNQLRAKVDAASRGGAPSLRNADAALVRAAFDPATMRAMPLTLDIGQACQAIGGAIVAYTEYASRVTAHDSDPTAASEALLLGLQDEMALGTATANICVQRGFRAVAPVVERMTADRRAGAAGPLKQMRDGAAQTIDGTLMSIAQPGVRPANRRMMLGAMLEDATELAASFPGSERQRVRQKILDYAAKAPAGARASENALAAAFATTRCNILCQAAGSE